MEKVVKLFLYVRYKDNQEKVLVYEGPFTNQFVVNTLLRTKPDRWESRGLGKKRKVVIEKECQKRLQEATIRRQDSVVEVDGYTELLVEVAFHEITGQKVFNYPEEIYGFPVRTYLLSKQGG